MKYTNILVTLLLALIIVPFASAALTINDVSLSINDAVERSNPLPERSDSSLDDSSELSYVTFTIPVTASVQAESVTRVTPNLNSWSYDSFAGNINTSAKYIVDTPLPLNVAVGQTQNLVLRVLVPSNLDSVDSSYNAAIQSITASIETSAGIKTPTLSFYVENGLELKKVTIKTADGDSIKCKVDNDKKSLDCDDEAEEMMRGRNFDIEFTVENTMNSDSELDFSDVEISIDSDNSDVEPSDDSYDEDIDADDEQVFSVSFDVDDSVDDSDDSTITIEASVEDDNNALHGFTHEFDVRFDTKSYEIATPVMSLNPTAACAGNNVAVTYTLENLGSKRQSNVRPVLVNDAFNLNKVLTAVELKEEDKSGNVYRGTTTITVPNSARPGSYPIQLQIYYRDEDSQDALQTQSATLTVQNCKDGMPLVTETNTVGSTSQNTNTGSATTTQPSNNGVVIVQPSQTSPNAGVTTTTQPTISGATNVPVRAVVSDSSDTPYLIGLGVAVLILVIIVGVLIAAVFRK